MVWLVIALVTALAIAPVMWMLPSASEQRVAKLRQRAMQLGLRVKACSLPQTHRQKVRREAERPGVAYILPIRQPLHQTPAPRWFIWRRPVDEAVADLPLKADLRERIVTVLEQMPANVMAMERDGSGLLVYWRESSDSADVDHIAKGLQELAELRGIGAYENE